MIAAPPSPISVAELNAKALTLRQRLVTTSASAKIPHLGSCLSCVELLVALYWQELRIDPAQPEDPDRDRFLLSKGHGAPILFQVLAERGFFPLERLEDFGKAGSVFHEHPPKPGYIPGIEAATGSLGHGLPMALGMALAARIQLRPTRCYALLSDGECNEGSIWEAALLAASHKVHNLTAIIDFNKWQATGRSQEVMALDPLAAKWEAFGWHAQEIEGHDFEAIAAALAAAHAETERPSVIVSHTVKGKGVSFMEDDNNWHYRTPNPDELAAALAELEPV
ncbi:MAG: transketolase [Cyanobacteria bacterium K_DeepCast_35m_m1_288]|nr:transketolase [Cyanobacteria bacterium K_DeepCast_35m_m1_288]